MHDDGLDAAICLVKPHEKSLIFAGAKLPLYFICNDKLTLIKGDKQSLGYKKSDLNFTFTSHTVNIESGTSCYSYTDVSVQLVKAYDLGSNALKICC